jgi:outer membrane lipoprotein carrier protein
VSYTKQREFELTQINKLIIFILILLNGEIGYTETPEQQALEAFQQKYENILTFEADFTQRSYVKMMDKAHEAKGRVQIKKPGKMKWVYGSPDIQVLISNGKTLWHYVSDENQVTKVPIESIYSSNTPALFLAGEEKLTQIFNIENVDTNPLSFTLSPKEEDQALRRLQLFANKKNFQITGSTVYDKLGNKTEIRFSNIKTNLDIPEKTFQFQVPPDTEVLDYTKGP